MGLESRPTIAEIENALLEARRTRGAAGRTALIVVGPPGSGKSTVVSELSRQSWLRPANFYLEDAQENPHLTGQTIGPEADLRASQNWFLRRYERFLSTNLAEASIVLDQDPRAVVLVYSKIFAARGWLTADEYRLQLDICEKIQSSLSRGTHHCFYVLLRAHWDVLHSRNHERGAENSIPDDVLNEVLQSFDSFFTKLKAGRENPCIEFDTGVATTHEIAHALERFMIYKLGT